MEHSHYLYDTLTYLAAAVFVVLLCKRLRLSSVLGYLAAGIVIGPHSLNIIHQASVVHALAEFGVVFLLFTIGLGLSWGRLYQLRRYVFGLGSLQVLVTGLLIFLAALYFGLSVHAALIIGSALALSSTAVVMQVLGERGELSSRWGRVSFSVLLAQDLAVVGLLVLITILNAHETSIMLVLGKTLANAVLVIAAIALIGRYVLRPVYRAVSATQSSEIFMAMSLIVILGTSWATNAVGLSMELGAFLAGLMIAETEYRHQIEGDIEAFKGLLLGLFFVSVGMSMDMLFFIHHLGVISALILGLLAVKTIVLFVLARFFGLSTGHAMRVGLLLAAGGEFVFVVLSPAVDSGLVTLWSAQVVYLAVAISMALTPALAALGVFLSRHLGQEVGIAIKAAEEETVDLKGHIIIAGYGRVGQAIAEILASHMVPFVAIDMNMTYVSWGRAKGFPVFYGDARRAEVLTALGAERAKAAVVTLETFNASSRSVMMMRRHFPNLSVFVRVRESSHAHKLEQMGATAVVPETLEPSLQLAAAALDRAGVSADQITHTIENFRTEFMESLLQGGNIQSLEDE